MLSINKHLLTETESMLVNGCIAGNRNSQSELYARFSPKMLVVCMRYATGREEAEEILQEGFIKVFEFLHQYKGSGLLEGWVRKIMINTALQKLRSRANMRPVITMDTVEQEVKYEQDIIGNIGAKELLKLVQALPTAYRLVFNLYVFEGYKHREIAELLFISEGTSKSNLFDARNILQRMVNNSLQIAK